MQTVLLLHHDLEWAEERMIELLPGEGVRLLARDVRGVGAEEVRGVDVLLNRVYASVANRDFGSIDRALMLCAEADAAGVHCINSPVGCRADYDKAFAAELMQAKGVATPATIRMDPGSERDLTDQVVAALEQLAGPIVLKRNTGGRAVDVLLIRSPAQARSAAAHAWLQRSRYPGAWVVQAYASNPRGHDCRIAVAEGRVLYAFGRTLVKGEPADREPWLASVSRGSKTFPHRPDAAAVDLAVRASGAVGADLNEIDMGFTAGGPVVIENNATPQFVGGMHPTHSRAFIAEVRQMALRTGGRGGIAGGPGRAPDVRKE